MSAFTHIDSLRELTPINYLLNCGWTLTNIPRANIPHFSWLSHPRHIVFTVGVYLVLCTRLSPFILRSLIWYTLLDLNQWPSPCHRDALPTELRVCFINPKNISILGLLNFLLVFRIGYSCDTYNRSRNSPAHMVCTTPPLIPLSLSRLLVGQGHRPCGSSRSIPSKLSIKFGGSRQNRTVVAVV